MRECERPAGTIRFYSSTLRVGIQPGGTAEMMLIEGHARELLDAAPDAMVFADSSGTILYANGKRRRCLATATTS
jgi:PAS domain-containing protein